MSRLLSPPADESLHKLAHSLARPVAHGWLTFAAATGIILVAVLKAERAGTLAHFHARDVHRGHCDYLRGAVARERQRRDDTKHAIRTVLRPLIALHKPSRALLAEAHGVNGAADFPLAEPEVNDLVALELWYALPRGSRSGP